MHRSAGAGQISALAAKLGLPVLLTNLARLGSSKEIPTAHIGQPLSPNSVPAHKPGQYSLPRIAIFHVSLERMMETKKKIQEFYPMGLLQGGGGAEGRRDGTSSSNLDPGRKGRIKESITLLASS